MSQAFPHPRRIAPFALLGTALFLATAPAPAAIGAEEDAAPAVLSDSGCAGADALPADEPSADDAFAAQQAAAQDTSVTNEDRSTGRTG